MPALDAGCLAPGGSDCEGTKTECTRFVGIDDSCPRVVLLALDNSPGRDADAEHHVGSLRVSVHFVAVNLNRKRLRRQAFAPLSN